MRLLGHPGSPEVFNEEGSSPSRLTGEARSVVVQKAEPPEAPLAEPVSRNASPCARGAFRGAPAPGQQSCRGAARWCQ